MSALKSKDTCRDSPWLVDPIGGRTVYPSLSLPRGIREHTHALTPESNILNNRWEILALPKILHLANYDSSFLPPRSHLLGRSITAISISSVRSRI